MLASTLTVDAYLYPTLIHLYGKTTNQIKTEARNIITNLSSSQLFRQFYVDPRLLEHYNNRFSEKQVKRIDDNFYDYSLGTKFPLTVPLSRPPPRLRYLIQKFFSGDVSGDISEALFTYFMVEVMQIAPNDIGHIRPEKRQGFLSPDFLVYDRSFNLSGLFQKRNFPLPVLSEVKGFTGVVDVNRVHRALLQLGRLILNRSLIGIVFLAIRNEIRHGYDAYIIRVER